MPTSQKQKEAFFAQLDAFDDVSTESEDDCSHSAKPQSTSQHVVTAVSSQAVDVPPLKEGLARSGTDDLRPARRISKSVVRNSHSGPNSAPAPAPAPAPKTNQGRKLFEGFIFFFIPNDDVDKVRKLRIQSAIRNGARWARKLDSTITHIVVDSKVHALGAFRVLKDRIDVNSVALVKDRWLVESLSHKDVRDPSQGRFQLTGFATLAKAIGKAADPNLQSAARKPSTDLKITGSTARLVPGSATDELSKIIDELKAAQHPPFDGELDLGKFISQFSEDEHSDTQPLISTPAFGENKGFVCMEPHPGVSDNPNNRTIEILQQMATYYDCTGDRWRTTAYRRAISALRKQDELVSTRKEALAIHGIGGRLADKIEEIVTTDRLARLDEITKDPTDQVLQLFMGIYGVGLNQARLWMDQGYRTLEDLKALAALSPNQRIGIEHHDDFQTRIPREEVAKHGAIVQKALKRADHGLEAIIGGSYRRGMPDSGDIDVMITHPTADLHQIRTWTFETTVPYLFRIGFMKYALATSRGRKQQTTPAKSRSTATPSITDTVPHFAIADSNGTKFLGASQLSPSHPWRRIDLLLVPACSLGASLLYFTGNDIFNRSMRLLASRKGMRLNQHGLYKGVLRGPGRVKETEGDLIEGRSEKRIFEILGVPWRKPEERRC